ncbi:hypothetical protein ACFL6U_26590 [Planctomycetota bacterium]
MKCEAPVVDNITELLNRILAFTRKRHCLLIQNLENMGTPGFVPHDLPVIRFSKAIEEALTEHVLHQRLIWRDSEALHINDSGDLHISAVRDEKAFLLKQSNRHAYQEHLSQKLVENELNRRVTLELLNQNLPSVPSPTASTCTSVDLRLSEKSTDGNTIDF